MRKFTLCAFMLAGALCAKAQTLTVNDLTGRYVEYTKSSDIWNSDDWVDSEKKGIVTISAVDENTIDIYNLDNWECSIQATVNWEDKSITIDPQIFGWYEEGSWDYRICAYLYDGRWGEEDENGFASYGSPATDPILGTFDEEGNIKLNSWMIVYNDYVNLWGECAYESSITTLTKVAPEWSAACTWKTEEMGAGTSQLSALSDGLYILDDFMGEGLSLLFSVDEDTQEIVIYNGDTDDDDTEWFYVGYDSYGLFTTDGLSSFKGDVNEGELTIELSYWPEELAEGEEETYDTYTLTWNTVGVNTAKAEAAEADAPVYSLSGIRVAESAKALNNLPKGIYIVNGKKYAVK